jgi:uroporphyrinogen-III synthase
VHALAAAGLEPIAVPTIEVRLEPPGGPLDAAVRDLAAFGWVAVTSPNGAAAVLAANHRVGAVLGQTRWAAVGSATAAVLERVGVAVDFLPDESTGRALADGLPIEPGDRVLLPRGDLAGEAVPAGLLARGAVVVDVVAYRTHEAPATSRGSLRAAFAPNPPDAVILTSGSTARGLLRLADDIGLDVRGIAAVCAGPETAREVRRLGFGVAAVSRSPDPAALADATATAVAEPVASR